MWLSLSLYLHTLILSVGFYVLLSLILFVYNYSYNVHVLLLSGGFMHHYPLMLFISIYLFIESLGLATFWC